ncbi:unnamed protein product, partial [Candidula unifasciata]
AEKWKKKYCLVKCEKKCWCKLPDKYHSLQGTEMLFNEFVVYDENQCLPVYIIKYKRIGEQ